MTTSATARRIQKEIAEIGRNPSIHWKVMPVDDDMYEWHFTVRGPEETEFEGGRYHGRICLPNNYPFAPPSIMLLTPNGRFEINKKICLSVSNFHPELWQPAWGIRTILEALRSFFPSPPEGAVGSLDWPPHVRKQIALEETASWRCEVCKATNAEILPCIPLEAESSTEVPDTSEHRPVNAADVPTAVGTALPATLDAPQVSAVLDAPSSEPVEPVTVETSVRAEPVQMQVRNREHGRWPTLLPNIPSGRREWSLMIINVLILHILLAFGYFCNDVLARPPF